MDKSDIEKILNESNFIQDHRSADCVVECCYCKATGSYYIDRENPVNHLNDCIVTKLKNLV